jgi:polar amino acid transport system substrate-binding protein
VNTLTGVEKREYIKMTSYRSGFSGLFLKVSLCSIFFLFLFTAALPGQNASKTKTSKKNISTLQKKNSQRKPLEKKGTRKPSQKEKILKEKIQKKKTPGETGPKKSLAKKVLTGGKKGEALKKTSPVKKTVSGKNLTPQKVSSTWQNPQRKITVVMENYPPNYFIENIPGVISGDIFKNSVLKKLKDKSKRDLLLSVYHADRKTGKYSLSGKADRSAMSKAKDILFSVGFLKVSGFEAELTQAVFSSMGIQPVFMEYPWARCIEMMKSGRSDAIMTIFKTQDRTKFLYYPSEPTSVLPNVLFKLKSSRLAFDGDLKKLKKYVIGVKSSTSYGEKFDHAGYLRKEEVPFNESLIRLVETGRVDVGIMAEPVLKHLMKNGNGRLSLLRPYVSQEPLYVAFSRKSGQKKLSEEFSVMLAKFKKTEKYKKILKKYGIVNT